MKRRILFAVIILFVLLPIPLGLLAVEVVAAVGSWQVEGNYLDADGVKVHYTDQGNPDGPPVIFIHGFAVNQDINWRIPGHFRKLKDDYRIIGIDARGHGLSDKPYDRTQYGNEMVKDIARLMDHLEIEKAHIVGYSMGGFLTLVFCNTYPERIISATAGGAGYFPRGEYPELVQSVPKGLRSGQQFLPIATHFEAPTPMGWIRARFSNALMCRLNDLEAMAACFESLNDLEIAEERFSTNKVPILTVVGTEDPLKKAVENMLGRVPNHENVWVEGGNHLSVVSARQFTDGLRAFLDKHSREDSSE